MRLHKEIEQKDKRIAELEGLLQAIVDDSKDGESPDWLAYIKMELIDAAAKALEDE